MRFQNYLIETLTDVKDIEMKIMLECKPFLKTLKDLGGLFYRGIESNDYFLEKPIREDRIPKGMNPTGFKKLNAWLERNKHLRRDKAVIATSEETRSTMFGNKYFFFIPGDFQYTWLYAKDTNFEWTFKSDSFKEAMIYFLAQNSTSNYEKNRKQSVIHMKPIWQKIFNKNFVTNKDIKIAFEHGYEIWFKNDEMKYYAVSTDTSILKDLGL